jgi:hypothetical protein
MFSIVTAARDLLAVGRHHLLGAALLVAGLAMLLGHVLLDLRRG